VPSLSAEPLASKLQLSAEQLAVKAAVGVAFAAGTDCQSGRLAVLGSLVRLVCPEPSAFIT
jgi:hypothetical protein